MPRLKFKFYKKTLVQAVLNLQVLKISHYIIFFAIFAEVYHKLMTLFIQAIKDNRHCDVH